MKDLFGIILCLGQIVQPTAEEALDPEQSSVRIKLQTRWWMNHIVRGAESNARPVTHTDALVSVTNQVTDIISI